MLIFVLSQHEKFEDEEFEDHDYNGGHYSDSDILEIEFRRDHGDNV